VKNGIEDEGHGRWEQLQIERRSSTMEQNDTNVTSPIARPLKRPCLDPASPNFNEAEIEWEGPSRRKELNAVVDILRDLSLEASGGYIGASSSITMSRMVGSLVKAKAEPAPVSYELQDNEHLSPRSLSIDDGGVIDIATMPEDVAEKLLNGYLKHISTRWPILHSTYLRALHAKRHALANAYEKSVLHLVYASGGRFLETTGETGAYFPDRHHAAGMEYLDELLQYHDIRSVQILILLAIYSLRAPKGPGAW
jgi:hypothetical protein